MLTGGRLPVEEFEIGWAVLVGRGRNGESPRATFPRRAHFYDASDRDCFRHGQRTQSNSVGERRALDKFHRNGAWTC